MEQINHLRNVLVRLPERDQSFASDLIRQHNERGLSPKQVYWVGKLIERATQPAPKPVKIGSLSAISGLFSKAKGRLKKPAIVLLCDFDYGEPVIPKPHFPLPQFFTSREDAIEHRDEVQEKLDRDFNCHLPPISSVLSQGRYAALIDENSYPKHWPEMRPHYE